MAPDQIKKNETYVNGNARRVVKAICNDPSDVMDISTRGVWFPAVIYVEDGESHICSRSEFAAWAESSYPWAKREDSLGQMAAGN